MQEKLVVLPDREFIITKLRELLPVGNSYLDLAYHLSKSAGQEVNAEGVYHWVIQGISDFGVTLVLKIAPKIIQALIEDEEMAQEASALMQKRLAEQGIETAV